MSEGNQPVANRRAFLGLVGSTAILTGVDSAVGTADAGQIEWGHRRGRNEKPVAAAGAGAGPARVASEWHQQARLVAADLVENDLFGESVALSRDGELALVGAEGDSDPNGLGAGSAYVFDASDGGWTQQARLVPDDGDGSDFFGSSVAVSGSGETAVVGARRDEDPNGGPAGSAYVFGRSDGGWTQQAKLAAEDSDTAGLFGQSVALSGSGETAVVGAENYEGPSDSSGLVFVFGRRDGEWTQRAILAPDDADGDDVFGQSVAASDSGETVLVGAEGDSDPNGEWAGSAYVFDGTDGEWTQRAKLTPDDGGMEDRFGSAVALSASGERALVGARSDDDPNGAWAGSAYMFDGSDGEWSQQAKLVPEDGDSRDAFGSSVALSASGGTALVGAVQDEDPNGEQAGSAYLFGRNDGEWTQQAKLTPNEGDSEDLFGGDVGLSGDTALVAAANDEGPDGEITGSAYVFVDSSGVGTTGTDTAAPGGSTAETDPPTETATGPPTGDRRVTETMTGSPSIETGTAPPETTTGSGPGLGVGSSLAGVGGFGYLLAERLDADAEDE